jgi:hypothetical protein
VSWSDYAKYIRCSRIRPRAHKTTNIQIKMITTYTGTSEESPNLSANGADTGLAPAIFGDRVKHKQEGPHGLTRLPCGNPRPCWPRSVQSTGYLARRCDRQGMSLGLFGQMFAFPCQKQGLSNILAKSRQICRGYVQRSRQCGDHDHPRGRRLPQGQRANDLPAAVGQNAAGFQDRWILAL